MPGCCVFSILQGCSPAAYENLLSQSENPKRNSCRALSRRLAAQSCRRLLLERGKGLRGPQGRASISCYFWRCTGTRMKSGWSVIFLGKGIRQCHMPWYVCVTGKSRENGRKQRLLKADRSVIPSTLNGETLRARKTDSLQKNPNIFLCLFGMLIE